MVHRLIHPKKVSGFTLVELLAVIAILVIILSIAAGALMPGNRSMDLSATSLQIKGLLDEGRQMALANNKYVQVRFYTNPTTDVVAGQTYYSAIGIYAADSPYYESTLGGNGQTSESGIPTGALTLTGEKIFYLPPEMGLPDAATVSQFLVDLYNDPYFDRKGTETIQGQTYNWVAFYYLPNGSADFQSLGANAAGTGNADGADNTTSPADYDPTRAYFTLVMRTDYHNAGGNFPHNFATFCVSPFTGRPLVLRP